jgi:hypothetical protein
MRFMQLLMRLERSMLTKVEMKREKLDYLPDFLRALHCGILSHSHAHVFRQLVLHSNRRKNSGLRKYF